MSKEEFYAEERAYEAAIEAHCERCRREEDEWDEFEEDYEEEEDEWESHGFRDEADYNNYRYGSARYL